ncbi:hypothetical protein [Nitrosopumilus sp.]|uniref:hypothetical protein n=1 Tax=Nitrosopumilus sp. TaxID=2024843 RepID=UPI0034A047B9
MNICSEAHTPVYKITYKGAKGSKYKPEWLVCENCHEKKYFGAFDVVLNIEKLY